ncbi:hypothetical protein J4Q44_G00362270 [Coregonus suidteri]|uniref:Disintegrin and metalloproteinase domain-containing protein 12 n=1 Tax=Coregonus suidteri TaxID=861788 RepID=A0AAN8QBR8_9TELE
MPEVKVLYGGQKCGNGYVEEGEECDCGELEECMNPCCNATTCTLKRDAVCAHGQCCHDCLLKPAGTPCRDSSNSCDLPEFCTGANPHCPANVYLHDGHTCHNVDGHCYNGICQTHEQQCITLWGQGAKPAPGICFERVNSAGDPYGNCGKDSKGSFAKCEAPDARCGKIQCQGGANRPIIGTNAVSIETNIPLQEGGRILCRGTHVYLGDDMPDPGLVMSGTKCGDAMMCLNRQCQNVSVFGVQECSGRCSGRGVCNNNKNCHCEAHWAPPFCDKAGFGGSVDSGPMRLADYGGVAVGVLAALITFLGAGLIICIKRKTLLRLLFTNKKITMDKLSLLPKTNPPRDSPTPLRGLLTPPIACDVYPSAPLFTSVTQSPCPCPCPCPLPPPLDQDSPHHLLLLLTEPHLPMAKDMPTATPRLRPEGRRFAVCHSTITPAGWSWSGGLIRSPTAVGVPIPVPVPGAPRLLRPVPHHNRSVPKQPPTLPKPRMIVHAKFSS